MSLVRACAVADIAPETAIAVEVDVPDDWEDAELLLDDGAVSSRIGVLAPWESRVHRRRRA